MSSGRARAGLDWRVSAVLYGFAVLRILAVVKVPPVRLYDSDSYFQLSFTGHAPRLWTTPLLFNFVGSDPMRVVGQALIGVACWSVLAVFVAAEVDHRRLQMAALALVCAVGLSLSVTNWDGTILSDSLTVSLTVLLLAAWLRELRHPSPVTFTLVLAATVLWVFTRQSHVLLGHLVTVVVAVSIIWAARMWRRAALAIGLTVVAVWGQYALQQNDHVATVNLHGVIIDRILPNAGYIAWFRDHGLPGPPPTYDAVDPTSDHYSPHYTRWLDQHGQAVYAEFLLTHPGYTLLSPWRHALPIINTQFEGAPAPSLFAFDDHYGRVRPVLPRLLELVLVDPGGAGLLLMLLGGVGVGVVVGWRRRGYDRRWTLPLAVLAVNVPHVLLVWHGSPAELGRHSLALSISTRLALLMLALFLADAWLDARVGRSATT